MKSQSSAAGRPTHRSSSTASPGCATCCPSTSWRSSTRTRDRLELVGGLARRIFARQGHPGADHHDRRPRRRRGRRGRRAAPAAGRRPGGPPPGRDLAAGVRLRRPGDHRRRRSRQGAAHGSGRPRHRRAGPRSTRTRTPGSSTSPTRSGIVTRALLQAGHRAVGLCNVAIGFQRKLRRHARGRARPGRSWTTSGSTTSPGRRAVARGRRRPAARSCSPSTSTSSPTTSSCRAGCSASWAWCRRTTCATSTRTTRWSPSSWLTQSRAAAGGGDRARAAADCTRDPSAGREAGAADQARRRLLLRGRRGPARVPARAAAATCRW